MLRLFLDNTHKLLLHFNYLFLWLVMIKPRFNKLNLLFMLVFQQLHLLQILILYLGKISLVLKLNLIQFPLSDEF